MSPFCLSRKANSLTTLVNCCSPLSNLKKILNKIWKIKDLLERKKSFDAMKSDFYKYVISIPAKVENPPPEVGFLCYVKNAILADYYNPETGFITKDNRSLTIW